MKKDIRLSNQNDSFYFKYSKRIFDLITGLVVLILAAPIIMLSMIAMYFTIGRPVVFKQQRPGLGGKPFVLYKLRTMKEAEGSLDTVLTDRERLTKMGSIMRKLSVDELPQLINVIKGEISIVGPRPLLMEYLPLYSKEQRRRHDVRPGITGWAQVNGRNLIDWDDKFRLDLWYVDNISFLLDMKILMLTLIKVLKAEGINHRNMGSASKFTGDRNDG